jgi:lipopolysaccharide/colanic/teichoic acid biosynthesis glycosyltransferase
MLDADNGIASALAGLELRVRTTLAEREVVGADAADRDVWSLLAESLPPKRRRRRGVELFRRALDAALAAVLLTVLSPFLLLIALAIWWDDRGSVLFGHRRVTAGGKTFICWKFRTMHVGTHEELCNDLNLWAAYVAADFKIEASNDHRITRLGRFLRSSYLDELPQLWNVVRGEMSLVGPRPVVVEELVWYGPLVSEFLTLRPGITGAWQLTDRLGYPQRAWLELAYVRSRSLALDAQIAFLTLLTVLTASPHPVARLAPPQLALPAEPHDAPSEVIPVASEA